MGHAVADKRVYCHEALHMREKLTSAGYKQKVEKWDTRIPIPTPPMWRTWRCRWLDARGWAECMGGGLGGREMGGLGRS